MSRLLDQALPLDTEGRRRWLEALPPEHQPLAAALREALLPGEPGGEPDASLANLIGIGASGYLERIDSTPQAGETVGPYRLIRALGEGGMAQVWLAERADGAFKRDVALKLPMLVRVRQDLSSRFVRERDILAGLEHPHIARLYDAGVSADGLPYLAMEYVAGEPLTSWCDAHRLSVLERLRLFLQVLDAVQYAHSQRVIHRDIKPSNILVTADGQVRLLDFGIAKLLAQEDEGANLTQLYGRALTPSYASPELVRGEPIGPTVDIYALGVVLYELLCGSRPYELNSAVSVEQLERAITTLEVKPPSTRVTAAAASGRGTSERGLVRRVRGDLDAIVLKALGKAPADRYDSAAAFAADCERSLRGEPVQAHPDRLGYRASKFLSRHRGVLATAAAVALVAGVLGYALAPLSHRTSKASATTPSTTAPSIAPVAASKPRIAILPFENLSPDPNNAFFTEGMHEEVLTSLSNASPDLEVISRTTMDSYKGKSVTVEQLAHTLGCTYVLEGSVRREGKEVRVTLQLINAKDDSHIWAQDYDRKLVSAMALQTEIARDVASQLSVRLTGLASPRSSPSTTNPLAYDVYLKGRVALQELSATSSSQDWEQARSFYDRAIELDPTFAKAYVDRIFIRTQLLMSSLDASDRNLRAAEQDLTMLRKLAPNDPETLFAEGLVAYAEIHYAKALQLFDAAERGGYSDPALLGARAALLLNMGRFAESEQIDRKLASLDPANSTRQYDWWFSLMELKRPQEAIAVANLGIQRWAHNPALASLWQGLRLETLFFYTYFRMPDRKFPPASAATLPAWTDTLRYEDRNREAREYIDASKAQLYHADLYWVVKRGDLIPVADLRGWFDLFLNDKTAARRDGERVLDYLAKTPEPRRNQWLRALLRADAALFMGDDAGAVKYIEESVALADATEDVSDQSNAKMWRAMIYAWVGRTSEAAQLLEGFATSIPGLWPGEVVHNPCWNIPLRDEPRYRALRARLIAQMKATKLQ